MKKLISSAFVIAALAGCATPPSGGNKITLKQGESADLGAVYWIADCRSLLKGFDGIDVLKSPPGVKLSIREEEVFARAQNCPQKVKGGTVVVTAEKVTAAAEGDLQYRVRYRTEDGPRQSTHAGKVTLIP